MRHGCRTEEVRIAAVGQKRAAGFSYVLVTLRPGDPVCSRGEFGSTAQKKQQQASAATSTDEKHQTTDKDRYNYLDS